MITKAAFESLIYEEKCQLVARELNTLASVGWVFIDLKKSFEIVEQHSEEVLNSYHTIITRYYSIARDEVFSQRHEKEMQLQKKIAEQESQEKNNITLNL